MVKQRKGIGRKPTKPSVDDFVAGGNDAELPTVSTTKEQTKEYNHRISLDVDEDLYMALKLAALKAKTPMVQMIRDVLSEHVST
ncbi:MAG: hypothetical protein AAGF93_01770 [Cyanobacteria bacterium P01_H01_bin.105]